MIPVTLIVRNARKQPRITIRLARLLQAVLRGFEGVSPLDDALRHLPGAQPLLTVTGH